MTSFEHLKAMSIEELAEWLDENGQQDTAPWQEWFSNKYCNNCESIKCKYEDTEKTLGFTPYMFGSYRGDVECSYCEIYKKCIFFEELEDTPNSLETIKMWLNEEIDR